eukprot:TRINITY_DN5127_c0_g1_i2.p1 TRINITY_DN5127_c0_g1~~TRINITY_DN5127_c0_g1_i2.p1  ORF type:complete len:644 (+),score=127.60 TRINITY_DN5127_c0_g1_i2:185-2116(+)
MKEKALAVEDDETDDKTERMAFDFEAKYKMQKSEWHDRLKATAQAGTWYPRVEKIAAKLSLSDFEKNTILFVLAVSLRQIRDRWGRPQTSCTVGDILTAFATTVSDDVNYKKCFYKSSKLVREGLVKVDTEWTSELSNCDVTIDRRMIDYFIGLPSKIDDIMENMQLYMPKENIDNVILPAKLKQSIIDTTTNFANFFKEKKTLFSQDTYYGYGCVLLFHGTSGTGKTMMANALSAFLKKKLLLVNYSKLSYDFNQQMKLLFREAVLTDSIIFFDECDAVLATRSYYKNSTVHSLLTEIERHPGIIIMATNQPFQLDEAMHRRITLNVEFPTPDPIMRESIWKVHLPKNIDIKDEELKTLARRFELTGGLIKNAIMLSVNMSFTTKLPVSYELFEKCARQQLIDTMKRKDEWGVSMTVPKFGLERLIVSNEVKQELQNVIDSIKAKKMLVQHWGYDSLRVDDETTLCLFYGPRGVGKSYAAEIVGYELGRPIETKNFGVSVSESERTNIILLKDDDNMFSDPVYFERLKSRTSQLTRLRGQIVIIVTERIEDFAKCHLRKFNHIVKFDLPSENERQLLWKEYAVKPNEENILEEDLNSLVQSYPFSASQIKQCSSFAFSEAIKRDGKNKISAEDLRKAATRIA